jgi:hypothetical protein
VTARRLTLLTTGSPNYEFVNIIKKIPGIGKKPLRSKKTEKGEVNTLDIWKTLGKH